METQINDISPDTIPVLNWDEVVKIGETINDYGTGTSPVGRAFQSTNFKTGSTGWQLKPNGDAEFGNGTFRGAIAGSTINIPDAASPLFSVDSLGNVVAESLRRKDFHWFTFFESIDGFQDASTGTGAPTVDYNGLNLSTGATSGSECYLIKGTTTLKLFTWSKSRSIKTVVTSLNTANSPEIFVTTGCINTATDNHFGFQIIGADLYGHNGNGSIASQTNLTDRFSSGVPRTLEAIFDPGVDIKYYVDGVLRATVTTNLPTGTDLSWEVFNGYIKNATAADRGTVISMFDFWQAN